MNRAGRVLALAAAAGALLTGCSASFDKEWSSTRAHESVTSTDPTDAELTLDAGDYDSFYEAVRTFIARGVERGAVRIASYAGDMDTDIAQAVFTASNATPEGAYCVYYINYSTTRLVSVYEVNISIIYRHTPRELEAIGECSTDADMEALMLGALKDRRDDVTVRVSDESMDEAAISAAIEKAYYENPEDILYIPSYSVTSYPETGGDRILEIALSYPYATSTVEARRISLTRRTDEIISGLGEGTVTEKLTRVGEYLSRNVAYATDVNSSDIEARRYSAMTAYGALVQGSAVGEGYAMAVKTLCDRLGVECTVVRGRFNNIDHSWNLVRLENGELYHMDASGFDPAGAVFRTDEQQLYANYWWDRSVYPPCSGPSLYGPEFDPPVAVDPDPPVGPQN